MRHGQRQWVPRSIRNHAITTRQVEQLSIRVPSRTDGHATISCLFAQSAPPHTRPSSRPGPRKAPRAPASRGLRAALRRPCAVPRRADRARPRAARPRAAFASTARKFRCRARGRSGRPPPSRSSITCAPPRSRGGGEDELAILAGQCSPSGCRAGARCGRSCSSRCRGRALRADRPQPRRARRRRPARGASEGDDGAAAGTKAGPDRRGCSSTRSPSGQRSAPDARARAGAECASARGARLARRRSARPARARTGLAPGRKSRPGPCPRLGRGRPRRAPPRQGQARRHPQRRRRWRPWRARWEATCARTAIGRAV